MQIATKRTALTLTNRLRAYDIILMNYMCMNPNAFNKCIGYCGGMEARVDKHGEIELECTPSSHTGNLNKWSLSSYMFV